MTDNAARDLFVNKGTQTPQCLAALVAQLMGARLIIAYGKIWLHRQRDEIEKVRSTVVVLDENRMAITNYPMLST